METKSRKLSLTTSLRINATKSEVWEALTNPEWIKKYFFGTEVISDFKKGSPIRYKGEWQGKSYEDKGTILESERNEILKSTYWSSMSGTADVPENYATVTYELRGDDGDVELSISQDNIANEESKAHSEKNWQMVLQGMKKLLEK